MNLRSLSFGILALACLALPISSLMAEPGSADTTTSNASGSKPPNLTGITMTAVEISQLMGQGEKCMEYQHPPLGVPSGIIPCCLPCPTCPNNCTPNYENMPFYNISYWEPSAIVEVSCRTGYSMLDPGGIPARSSGGVPSGTKGAGAMQSCSGFNKPGNSHWYFEARVWAINGYEGGLRHQSALGGTNGERMRQCTNAGSWDTTSTDYWGYGEKKWASFPSRGAMTGPGGSWKAYVSDEDSEWAKIPTSGLDSVAKNVTPLKECKENSPDVTNCWGPVMNTGFVVHPNPTIAAALVALRAHTKALGNKAVSSDLGAGYKMDMDFPFPGYAGDFGQSMGMSGGSKVGSVCFKPGDPGPTWNGGQSPGAIPAAVGKLKPGKITATADINSGVYIFTFWVKTSCKRFDPKLPGPTPICHYEDNSP